MWQVVVQSEVGSLGVYRGQTIGKIGTISERLLQTEERFKPADETLRAVKLRQPVIRLDPVALRVRAVRVLRATLQWNLCRLPPHMHSKSIRMVAFSQPPVGRSHLKPRLRKVSVSLSTDWARRLKLFIR